MESWCLELAKNNFSYNVVNSEKMPFKSKFSFDGDDIKKAISADAEDDASAVPVADVVALTDSADNVENYMNTWEPARKNVKITLDKLIPANNDWNFFPEPDKETAILIAKSIYQQGQLAPAIVWEQENGTYMILGGHTRAAIISQLHEIFPDDTRFTTMLCHIYEFGQLNEAEARQVILLNNMTQRAQEQPSLLTKSIVSMIELEKSIRKKKMGVTTERIAEIVGKKFNISRGKINRIYSLRCLLPEFMSLYDSGELSEKQAYALSGMTKEIQRFLYENNQYKNLSSMQIKALKKSNDCSEMMNILTMPKEFSFSGAKVTIKRELPAKCQKFSFAVAADDAENFKNIIRNAVANSSISEESKSIIEEILSRA